MCVPVIQVRSVDEARSQWKFTGKKLMPLTSTNTKSDGLMKFPITARVGNMKFFFYKWFFQDPGSVTLSLELCTSYSLFSISSTY